MDTTVTVYVISVLPAIRAKAARRPRRRRASAGQRPSISAQSPKRLLALLALPAPSIDVSRLQTFA